MVIDTKSLRVCAENNILGTERRICLKDFIDLKSYTFEVKDHE